MAVTVIFLVGPADNGFIQARHKPAEIAEVLTELSNNIADRCSFSGRKGVACDKALNQ
jgi:hypothetical protein